MQSPQIRMLINRHLSQLSQLADLTNVGKIMECLPKKKKKKTSETTTEREALSIVCIVVWLKVPILSKDLILWDSVQTPTPDEFTT